MKTCPCLSTHTQTPCAPQLFLWGVWIRQLSLWPEQSSHCSEKDMLSTLFRGLSPSLALSQQGSVRQAKQRTLETPNTGTDSHNEHGNNGCKEISTLPLPQRQWKKCLRDEVNCSHFKLAFLKKKIKPIILLKK